MLTLLIVLLHDTSYLPNLLKAWRDIGVPGVTIMESVGGFQAEKILKRSGLSALLNLFDQNTEKQRFIFSLIENQNVLDQAISEADRVVGGFDRPNSGILFTVPIGQTLGLIKRREKTEEEIIIPQKNSNNLLSWFEEEIKDQYGAKTISDWDKKRKQQVSKILPSNKSQTIICATDTPLDKILEAFKINPEVSLACIINSEERLVGLIDSAQILEMKLIPTMPENFIKNPEGFEKAIAYAKKYPEYLASDIMKEAVYIINEGTVEDAFLAFQSCGLSSLPLVNKHYRVKGMINLIDLV